MNDGVSGELQAITPELRNLTTIRLLLAGATILGAIVLALILPSPHGQGRGLGYGLGFAFIVYGLPSSG